MKRLAVVALAILVLGASTSHAEEPKIEVGLKGGLNVSGVHGPSTDGIDTSTKTGGIVGAFLRFNFGDRWSLQQELNYSEKGGKVSFSDTTAFGNELTLSQLNMNYLELPLLAIYNLTTGGKVTPQLFAGAAVAFRVRGQAVGLASPFLPSFYGMAGSKLQSAGVCMVLTLS